MIPQSLLWSWIKSLLVNNLNEEIIRYGATIIGRALGYTDEANLARFVRFIVFLSQQPASILRELEQFLGHPILFGAPNTPIGATSARGAHDPDLPYALNRYQDIVYQLRASVMYENALANGMPEFIGTDPSQDQ